ncbi:hypothetical protein EW145_g7509 [Phellinidium pouzarii]|uniref:Uncharacterized protein n=1 Tax=Phellinidium pouzarii TaxID=167371 RepID=A0A4S4KI15_9AGAM|nr:hypothetical protein EW145_g7509 [Phellinidium pouzarii]
MKIETQITQSGRERILYKQNVPVNNWIRANSMCNTFSLIEHELTCIIDLASACVIIDTEKFNAGKIIPLLPKAMDVFLVHKATRTWMTSKGFDCSEENPEHTIDVCGIREDTGVKSVYEPVPAFDNHTKLPCMSEVIV